MELYKYILLISFEAFNEWYQVNSPKIIASLVTLTFFLVFGYILKQLTYRYGVRVIPKDIARSISNTIFYFFLILAGFSILNIFDIDLTGMLIAGGIAGIILGFASQTVVSNLMSGIFLYIDRPVKEGDPVEVEGVGGRIVDIGFLSTRIVSWDGVLHRLPNDKVFTSPIKNFSRTTARRVEYRIGISYKSDVKLAKEVILKVINEEPLALIEPGPQVFVSEFGDSAIILNVRFWAPTPKWFDAKMRVLENIKYALDEAGIEIPYPQRVVWLKGDKERG